MKSLKNISVSNREYEFFCFFLKRGDSLSIESLSKGKIEAKFVKQDYNYLVYLKNGEEKYEEAHWTDIKDITHNKQL